MFELLLVFGLCVFFGGILVWMIWLGTILFSSFRQALEMLGLMRRGKVDHKKMSQGRSEP